MPTRARRRSRSIRCWSSSRSRWGRWLIALLLAVGSPTVRIRRRVRVQRDRRADVPRVARTAVLAARAACGAPSAGAADRAAAARGVRDDVPADVQPRHARNRLPGFRGSRRQSAAGGVLLAIIRLGSAIGGLIYGGAALRVAAGAAVAPRTRPRGRADRHPRVHRIPVALTSSRSSSGFLIAPTLTMVTLLVSSYAPSRYATEAFTWSATCIISGIGAGKP